VQGQCNAPSVMSPILPMTDTLRITNFVSYVMSTMSKNQMSWWQHTDTMACWQINGMGHHCH